MCSWFLVDISLTSFQSLDLDLLLSARVNNSCSSIRYSSASAFVNDQMGLSKRGECELLLYPILSPLCQTTNNSSSSLIPLPLFNIVSKAWTLLLGTTVQPLSHHSSICKVLLLPFCLYLVAFLYAFCVAGESAVRWFNGVGLIAFFIRISYKDVRRKTIPCI